MLNVKSSLLLPQNVYHDCPKMKKQIWHEYFSDIVGSVSNHHNKVNTQ